MFLESLCDAEGKIIFKAHTRLGEELLVLAREVTSLGPVARLNNPDGVFTICSHAINTHTHTHTHTLELVGHNQ